MNIKIEPGKSYRTLDGRRANVVGIGPDDWPRPAIGYVDGQTVTCQWKLDGKHCSDPGCASDLVSEWREPVTRTVTMFLTPAGKIHEFPGEQTQPLIYLAEVVARKVVTITEGEGV